MFSRSMLRVRRFTGPAPPARGLLRGVLMIGIAAVAVGELGSPGASSSARAGWRLIDLGTLGGKVAYASGAVAINSRGEVIGDSWNNSSYFWTRSRAFLWRGRKLIPLGTLGGASSHASAINDRGQIVGWADTRSGKRHAFLWQNGHMRDLGVPPGSHTSDAVGITNSGLVVGVASDHVVVWQKGRIRDLGKPWNPNRGAETLVAALNDRGRTVGSTAIDYLGSDGRVFIQRAFLWDGRTLRSLPPRNARSEAIDINENGEIIGWTFRNDFRPVTWQRGQMHLLPLPPDRRGAFPTAINDKGEIIGYSWNDRADDDHAVLWRNGTVMDLGTLGGTQSEADAINSRDQIVGTSETALSNSETPVWDAFLWQDGRMIDLGPGHPAAINDRGQIIGDSGYAGHALVWLPD